MNARDVQQQYCCPQRPHGYGAVETLLVADALRQRHHRKADAHKVGQHNDDGPPLLQVRDDVGDVIFHSRHLSLMLRIRTPMGVPLARVTVGGRSKFFSKIFPAFSPTFPAAIHA